MFRALVLRCNKELTHQTSAYGIFMVANSHDEAKKFFGKKKPLKKKQNLCALFL